MRITLLACLSSLQTVLGSTIADTGASYSYINNHNEEISPLLHDLCSSTDFFKYYKLNLFTRDCPYFSEDGAFCGNRACAVDTIEEEDVPEVWRASILGKLTGPSATAASNLPLRTIASEPNRLDSISQEQGKTGETCVQEPVVQDDRNFCIPEDEGSECVYVSLVDNPERYTGYAGAHAHSIWRSIYRENCFDAHLGEQHDIELEEEPTDFSAFSGLSNNAVSPRKQFQEVLRDPVKSGHGIQDTCVEKRIFYRIISGMHASISMHICASYLNQLSGNWEPNTACFDQRLRAYPERISNIYFNYVLISRAIAKLQIWLKTYTFCSGDPQHDAYTSSKVLQITHLASQVKYDESPLFEDRLLKEDFRNRFRNISMLMDCVGCDKCRLWGKVQTAGYGTALKILFDDERPNLRRGELVALFNTFDRLAISISKLRAFGYIVPETRVDAPNLESNQVIDAELRNEDAKHILKTPMERISSMAKRFTGLGRGIRARITKSSIYADLLSELGHLGNALKFIMQSYVDLPRNIWARLFITHDTSFWDFLFDASPRDEL